MIQQSPSEERSDTVAFVQEWLMNADYDPSQFDRDFAAAIDARCASQAAQPAEADGVEAIPADIAEHVRKIGRVEWGQTPAHDAEGHGRHVADSVRMTAAHFGQTEDQHMHGLWLEGTETVLCHTGTSPNAPMTTRALVGAWNWLVDQSEAAATPKAPATDAGEVERLTHVIDRDRYAAAACVSAIEHVLHTRRWLREAGRGSYAYDDERYQEEFGLAFDEIQEALRPMRALSKDKTDCTRDEDKVKAARAAGAKKFAALAALATPPAPNDDLRAENERLREALAQVAGKNDLSGTPDDELEAAARNALYDCELIALAALKENRRG